MRSAARVARSYGEGLQRANVVAGKIEQAASRFAHPTYNNRRQRNLLHSAVSGSTKYAREITGHTGNLFSGMVRSLGNFGKNVLTSSGRLLTRGARRMARSRLIRPLQFWRYRGDIQRPSRPMPNTLTDDPADVIYVDVPDGIDTYGE